MNRQRQGDGQIFLQRAEIGRQSDLQRRRGLMQREIGAPERGLRLQRQVRHEIRLIYLRRLRANIGKFRQYIGVHGQQPLQQHQRIAAVDHFPGQQERHRPQQDRARLHAAFERLDKLVYRLGRADAKRLIRLKFRHDVMIIRVKPFRHLHRRDILPVFLAAARHHEIRRQINGFPAPLIPRRHRADHRRRIQNVIVQRKIIRRNLPNARLPLNVPMLLPHLARGFQKFPLAQFALPIGFERGFQFAFPPDARISKIG